MEHAMPASPADLAEAIMAANLPQPLAADFSVYFAKHEDIVLKGYRFLLRCSATPDVETFVRSLLKAPLTRDDLVEVLQPIQEAVTYTRQQASQTREEVSQLLLPIQTAVFSMLADRHQPPSSATSNVSQRFQQQCLADYNAVDTHRSITWCTFTGIWWPEIAVQAVDRNKVVTYVRNGHIIARKTPASEWVPLGLGPSLEVPENMVPMMAAVKSAFDKSRICVVPEQDSMGHTCFVIHVLDPALRSTAIYQQFKNSNQKDGQVWVSPSSETQQRPGLGMVVASELTFGHLDGQTLLFQGDRRPAKRCFTQHAFWALYWAKQKQWPTPDVVIDANHFGWTSPQVEESMRRTFMWLSMQAEAAAVDEATTDSESAVRC